MSPAPSGPRQPGRPFGRVLTAMVTPFDAEGHLDLARAEELAAHLVELGNDGLVVSGTTGEGPTTTDAEKSELVRAVAGAVGDRATVVAGVGTYDTAHTVELSREAEKAGAHGLLVVTPYYSRPPQSGLLMHFGAVAEATGLPIMLYDIPARSVIPIEVDTLQRLAEHPRIAAVKDARGDLQVIAQVVAGTELAYYCGDDPLNLPALAVGAVGFVSVTGHVVADRLLAMLDAFEAGEVERARTLNASMLPLLTSCGRLGGVMWSKGALRLRGLDVGSTRLPLPPLTDEQAATIAVDLDAAGVARGAESPVHRRAERGHGAQGARAEADRGAGTTHG